MSRPEPMVSRAKAKAMKQGKDHGQNVDIGLVNAGRVLDLLATGPGLVPVSGSCVLDLMVLILFSLLLVLTLVSQLLVTLIS